MRPVTVEEEAPRVLVVIPAFNEEATVGHVIAKLREVLPEADAVVVVDLSTDRTVEVARAAGARVLRLPVRLGIGGAVRTGFRYAYEKGYHIALQLDADGQHDPEAILSLLAPLKKDEADLVIGSRFLDREGYQSGHARRVAIRFFSWLTSLLTGVKVTDITSGFRAVGPRLLGFYARLYPVEYPDAEAILLAVYTGHRVKEIPVVMKARSAGKSSVTLSQSFYYPMKVMVSIVATVLGRNHHRRQARSLAESESNSAGGSSP